MDRPDKESRLANRVQVGDRMRAFVGDPLISGWFDRAIANATDAMVQAAVAGDGPQAMHKGLTINILKEVRALMLRAEAEGSRAAEDLQKRKHRSE